eukprot:363759-Chlamydomonas_euryale.AAC.34
MSALPNASKEVLTYLFGPPAPKGGGAQSVAKHDQARITSFFTRFPGKPPGTRQQQEELPEAAEAAEPGTEMTRDAASAPEPEPAAECFMGHTRPKKSAFEAEAEEVVLGD